MDSEKKRVSVVVSGRVQGVGFRYFVQREAENLGITGWVKNLGDGSVAAVGEGLEDVLQEFVDLLKKGPPFSSVTDIKVKWDKFNGSFSNFSIKFDHNFF